MIKGCQKIKIHTINKILKAKLISKDEKNDLALLKGDFKPQFVFPISTKPAELMDEIYVAGFPFGYRLSSRIKITRGIVSSLSGIGDDYSRIQIDAAMQPGNNGGPIYNNFGNILGVSVAKLDYKFSMKELNTIPELTNFGINANMLRSFLTASNLNLRNEVNSRVPNFGRSIQNGTFYISCLMTKKKYYEMKSKKVLFKEVNISVEEFIN